MIVDDNRIFIANSWVPSSSSETRDVVNPASGEVIARVARGTVADVDRAVSAATEAAESWSRTTPRHRAERMYAFAEAVQRNAEALIHREALNGGKPLSGARWEIEDFVIDGLRFFAGTAFGGSMIC